MPLSNGSEDYFTLLAELELLDDEAIKSFC